MTTATIESPTTTETALARVVRENQLSEQAGKNLMTAFQPYFAEAQPLIEQAKGIKVADATCVSEMKKAREVRLALKRVRTDAEKTRKAMKEDSLRAGRAIDGMNNILLLAIEPVEKVLEEQEKFAERAEAARKAKLGQERADQHRALGSNPAQYIGLADMGEEQWRACLHGAKTAKEEREKAEAEAARQREVQAQEAEKLREENARLRREQEAKDAAARKDREAIEAKARAEREAAEAVARQEREAREKLEREAAAKTRAEEAKAKEAEEARRRAQLAPDADKLVALAKAARSLEIPTLATREANGYLERFVGTMIEAIKTLERDANFLK